MSVCDFGSLLILLRITCYGACQIICFMSWTPIVPDLWLLILLLAVTPWVIAFTVPVSWSPSWHVIATQSTCISVVMSSHWSVGGTPLFVDVELASTFGLYPVIDMYGHRDWWCSRLAGINTGLSIAGSSGGGYQMCSSTLVLFFLYS